jgi:two-component sensor histidine kinase
VNAELERRVTERTADLSAANARLVEALAERTAAESALREGEARLRLAAEAAQMGVWEMDFVRNMGRLDARAAAMAGNELPADTWIALGGPEFARWVANIHPDDIPIRAEAVRAIREGSTEMVQMEYRVMRGESWAWLTHWRAVVDRDPETGKPTRAVGVILDTTGRALVEASLREALSQRDLLLREVYHRVKNNLQIVDGLLMLQARSLEDPRAIQALSDLRSRVYALGLVHAQLMASKNLETFDIAPFLNELIHNVVTGGGLAVDITVEACALEVGLDFAVPLGLLATELVTNCLKHAFPDSPGAVRVALTRGADGAAVLTVADDGRGPRAEGAPGVGASIIAGLVRQLSATISVDDEGGRTTTVVIPASEFA